jgi:hypothetical protein
LRIVRDIENVPDKKRWPKHLFYALDDTKVRAAQMETYMDAAQRRIDNKQHAVLFEIITRNRYAGQEILDYLAEVPSNDR